MPGQEGYKTPPGQIGPLGAEGIEGVENSLLGIELLGPKPNISPPFNIYQLPEEDQTFQKKANLSKIKQAKKLLEEILEEI